MFGGVLIIACVYYLIAGSKKYKAPVQLVDRGRMEESR